ncbi:MAG: hypothetical protein V3W45_03450 [Sedimentisphaerales bacterium]
MPFEIPDWLRFEILHRWENLATRKWINKNPRIIISIAAGCVLVLLVIMGLMLPKKVAVEVREYKKAWFYDLNTRELFVARSDRVAPIEAPSGPLPSGEPAGVRAYVFSYVAESNESECFIGFLEIANPDAGKKGPKPAISGVGGAEQWGRGGLIRRVTDKKWVPADSDKGKAILRELYLPNINGEVAHYLPP